MKQTYGDTWLPPQEVELIADIGPLRLEANRQIITNIRKRFDEGGDKILWLTDETPDDNFSKLEGVSFEHVPEWSEGRRASLQGVFFGRIALGNIIETPIAVKPYLSAPNPGIHEAAMHLYLESKGLRVYRLLGMSWSKEQGYAMISSFEEESRSLDNEDWDLGLEQPIGEYLTNLEAIEQVGESFGMLHGNGVIHNDAQVKNFAVNGKEVVLIDLTSARLMINSAGNVDDTNLSIGMYQDISRFIESLKAKGFLRDATNNEWDSFFTNVIATSYRSGLYRVEGELESFGINLKPVVEEVISHVSSSLQANS